MVWYYKKQETYRKRGNMKLKKIGLNNITVFVKFELELSDGINIIIGENGSGKTIFLKSIYDTCHNKQWDMLDEKYVRKYADNIGRYLAGKDVSCISKGHFVYKW